MLQTLVKLRGVRQVCSDGGSARFLRGGGGGRMRCWEFDHSTTDTRLRVWLAISALVPALAALLGSVTALILNSVRGSEPSGRHGREFRVDAMAGAGFRAGAYSPGGARGAWFSNEAPSFSGGRLRLPRGHRLGRRIAGRGRSIVGGSWGCSIVGGSRGAIGWGGVLQRPVVSGKAAGAQTGSLRS